MPYILPDGRRVSPEQPFVLGDVQYPPNYLKYSTEEDRLLLSIQWEDEPAPPPVEPVVVVPQTVTRLQARLALKRAGFLDLVVGKMALMNETDDARLYWDNAATWERSSPQLLAMAETLQLAPMQVDQLFIDAASLS